MKKHFIFTLALFWCALVSFGQDTVASSGGNASGANGNVSYTVGQNAYTTNTGSSGSVAQGVQQPFEIQTLLGRDIFNINLKMSVYPNPTTNLLSLEITNYSLDNVRYDLFDANGRLILSNKVVNAVTSLRMDLYPNAIYLLNITENSKTIKTFKIIKN